MVCWLRKFSNASDHLRSQLRKSPARDSSTTSVNSTIRRELFQQVSQQVYPSHNCPVILASFLATAKFLTGWASLLTSISVERSAWKSCFVYAVPDLCYVFASSIAVCEVSVWGAECSGSTSGSLEVSTVAYGMCGTC